MAEVETAAVADVPRPEESKVEEVLEEGEIGSDLKLDRAPEGKKHQLEHAWTFWFDNPNGKQKQATWGSSLRHVYTFSTVEDFWRYVREITGAL